MNDKQMRYDANKKSTITAYILWFFIGACGAHRFYCNQKRAKIMLIGTITSSVLCSFTIGLIGIAFFSAWALIDAFFIHKWIAEYNNKLIDSINEQTN